MAPWLYAFGRLRGLRRFDGSSGFRRMEGAKLYTSRRSGAFAYSVRFSNHQVVWSGTMVAVHEAAIQAEFAQPDRLQLE